MYTYKQTIYRRDELLEKRLAERQEIAINRWFPQSGKFSLKTQFVATDPDGQELGPFSLKRPSRKNVVTVTLVINETKAKVMNY